MIVIGTDGVRETRNRRGEMFGLERLHEAVSQNVNASAELIQSSVIGALGTFQANAKQEDDITLVIIKLIEKTGAAVES